MFHCYVGVAKTTDLHLLKMIIKFGEKTIRAISVCWYLKGEFDIRRNYSSCLLMYSVEIIHNDRIVKCVIEHNHNNRVVVKCVIEQNRRVRFKMAAIQTIYFFPLLSLDRGILFLFNVRSWL